MGRSGMWWRGCRRARNCRRRPIRTGGASGYAQNRTLFPVGRGQGEGVRPKRSFANGGRSLRSLPPHPNLLPAEEKGQSELVFAASLAVRVFDRAQEARFVARRDVGDAPAGGGADEAEAHAPGGGIGPVENDLGLRF